jgi:hypothetical protein
MVRPVRIRHNEILAAAHAALARGGREAEVRRAHHARVLERARSIVARAKEEDRLRRCARLSAHKALFLIADAFTKVSASTSSEIDRERWRESRELVEAELKKLVERTARR